jgi:hypothetical protein
MATSDTVAHASEPTRLEKARRPVEVVSFEL